MSRLAEQPFGPPDHRRFAADCARMDAEYRAMVGRVTDKPPRSRYWRLDADKNPVPCGMYEGTMQFETTNRQVAATRLGDGTLISTVFLPLDHNYYPSGPPLVFETAVFPPDGEPGRIEIVDRMSTWSDAVAVHWATVKRLADPAVYAVLRDVATAAEGLKFHSTAE